ncbi:CAP-Gly domain-containing linker protein 1 [Elysia marginata]|uniref:CAP-Gly domain-containing linker protein 1 n=1 Tax=Elysia marginata TaxID=1093978 RepID=A0AAV4JLI9_9GAST|nr:CAP-Gly domain-containing linker protein 1 [Elysia marginata]
MAYPGDSKKRRSFLPAPKKSPTSSIPPQQQFTTGPTASGSYAVLQRTYVSKLPGAQSSSSSVSPSSSLSSISLPASSLSSTSLSAGERQSRPLPTYQDESRCGVGLRVGARVKIGGIKPGILRYLGTTHLAPGIFCGIELLEADGKHDGEVNGHRYFYCPPNCGIFAPKEKVCIDTSVSSRLSSESDGNPYSSNESLTERTYKAFRSFEEGELEAVDCSVLSPENPYGEAGKRKVETPPDWGSRSTDSIDSQDSSYFQGKSKSRLPRTARGSNIPSPQGHSLKSPGSGGSAYAFGFPKIHEDSHSTQQHGKSGYELRSGDNHHQEKGIAAPNVQELCKNKHFSDENAGNEEQFESRKHFVKSESLRHARNYQPRPNNKQYLNFAFDPGEQEQQRPSDCATSEAQDIRNARTYSQHPEGDNPAQNRDSRLDATFEISRSPLPPSHSANRTFEVVSASPSVTSIREGRDGFPLTSTPEPGYDSTRFQEDRSFILDQQSSEPSSSFSSSETDTHDQDRQQTVTTSLSDSQVQSTRLLRHEGCVLNTPYRDQHVNVTGEESTREGSRSVGSVPSSAYQQGGYTASGPGKCGGDGNSCGLLPSQPHTPRSSLKSASYVVSSQGDDQSVEVNRANSYTVCAGHKGPESLPHFSVTADPVDERRDDLGGHNSETEKEIRPAQDAARDGQSSSSIPPFSQPENIVVAAAASLSNTVCRSHSASPCGRKVSSTGSNHEENGESSSSSGPPSSGGGDHRYDHLDDSSTGVSPEVSQVLEWDYGQEFIDGKIPPPLSRHHLNRHARNHSSDAAAIMTTSSSTGTSESLSDALLRDASSEPSSDTEMTPASSCSLADDSDQFEPPENDFENIDSLEDLDFPMLGKISAVPVASASKATGTSSSAQMANPSTTVMTDSGISERDESEMFKSTTSATSTSTLCGGGAGDNSFSDDCSREDDHSSSSVLAGNPVVSSSTTLSTSSTTSMKGVGSDSSQETLCVPDTPGSLEDKEFLSEDGEGEVDTVRLKPLQRVKVDADCNRSRGDSCGDDIDITSGSPASVVSLEDVSLVQDKTITCDTPGKGTSSIIPDQSPAANNLPTPSPLSTSPCISHTTLREKEGDVTAEELDIQDPAGLLSTRKERPVSLISTTSADTGYAPDTDSEIGTLTFNSPNTDWLDRCGVAHPTTFAPPEELGFNGPPSDKQEPQKCFQRTSTPLANSTPGNTADKDRASTTEVDYTNGNSASSRCGSKGSGLPQERLSTSSDTVPRSSTSGAETALTASSGAPSVGAPSSGQNSFEAEEKEEEEEEEEEEDNVDDFVPCQDLEFSFKVNAPIDFVAAGPAAISDEEEEGETLKRNPKRKAMTITRKRSENISHKMPNTSKVTSRLADYIKTPPVPARPREDREQQNNKVTRNNAKNKEGNISKKRLSAADIGNRPNPTNGTPNSRRASAVDANGAGDGDTAGGKEGGDSTRRSQPTPQPPKPIIKRAPPKSKWGDIMSQIETSKGTTKPKPKSEIKSSLAAYLNTPPPSLGDKGNPQEGDEPISLSSTSNSNQTPPRKIESRIKPLPPPPPKIDLSKVKSKLGVPTASSATKAQPKVNNSNSNPRKSLSREGSPAANGARRGSKRMSEPHILQGKQNKQLLSAANTRTNSVADSSIISSARSSITDLSISAADQLDADGTPSKRGSSDVSRKVSTNSVRSEVSEVKNGHSRSNRRTIEIKSNAPSNTPLSLPGRAIEIHLSNGSATLAGNNSSQRSTPSPVIIKPIKPKSGTSVAASSTKTNPTKSSSGTATGRKSSDVNAAAVDKARNSTSSKLDCRDAVFRLFPHRHDSCDDDDDDNDNMDDVGRDGEKTLIGGKQTDFNDWKTVLS